MQACKQSTSTLNCCLMHMALCRWVMYNQHQAALLELQKNNMHTQIDLKALTQPTDQVLQHPSLHAWLHPYCCNLWLSRDHGHNISSSVMFLCRV